MTHMLRATQKSKGVCDMKDSQSWKNHNLELFCCYVQPYDRDTANYFFHQEIWELEQAEYEFLRTLMLRGVV